MTLVVGGSGTLGRVMTHNLLAAGKAVRVMTRTPAKATALRDAGAEVVTGNLMDRESWLMPLIALLVIVNTSVRVRGGVVLARARRS